MLKNIYWIYWIYSFDYSIFIYLYASFRLINIHTKLELLKRGQRGMINRSSVCMYVCMFVSTAMNYYSHLSHSISLSFSFCLSPCPDNYIRPLIDAARDTSHQSAIINLRTRSRSSLLLNYRALEDRGGLFELFTALEISARPSAVT